jgi:hypothetical protein
MSEVVVENLVVFSSVREFHNAHPEAKLFVDFYYWDHIPKFKKGTHNEREKEVCRTFIRNNFNTPDKWVITNKGEVLKCFGHIIDGAFDDYYPVTPAAIKTAWGNIPLWKHIRLKNKWDTISDLYPQKVKYNRTIAFVRAIVQSKSFFLPFNYAIRKFTASMTAIDLKFWLIAADLNSLPMIFSTF